MTEASKHFLDAFRSSGIGSPQLECGCGRINYGVDSDCFDEGELEHLEAERQKNPKGYEAHDGNGVSGGEILGRFAVDGCPCNYAAYAERLLWANRNEIARFLRDRLNEEVTELARSYALVKDVGASLHAVEQLAPGDAG